MKHDPITTGKRKPVNLSLDTGIVAAARDCGINMSRVSEDALRIATKAAQTARWKEENREWIDAHREWVENNPLPLEHLRLF
jgi:antitoxin CcdA